MITTHTRRRLGLVAVATSLTVLLAACGRDDDPTADTGANPSASASYGPAAAGPHNDSDVSFATDMIPHHSQALEMAELALEKATNGTVKQLATAIKGAQTPEILQMSGWLVGWDEEVPGDMSGHSMSDPAGMGMMSDQDMQELEEAAGAAFDRLWVEMMIEHHEGAVSMSKAELSAGQNAEAKALAQEIITAQNREIAEMEALLKTLPSA